MMVTIKHRARASENSRISKKPSFLPSFLPLAMLRAVGHFKAKGVFLPTSAVLFPAAEDHSDTCDPNPFSASSLSSLGNSYLTCTVGQIPVSRGIMCDNS